MKVNTSNFFDLLLFLFIFSPSNTMRIDERWKMKKKSKRPWKTLLSLHLLLQNLLKQKKTVYKKSRCGSDLLFLLFLVKIYLYYFWQKKNYLLYARFFSLLQNSFIISVANQKIQSRIRLVKKKNKHSFGINFFLFQKSRLTKRWRNWEHKSLKPRENLRSFDFCFVSSTILVLKRSVGFFLVGTYDFFLKKSSTSKLVNS